MAGLLDFLLNGQGGGVLPPFAQNFGAGDPGNASPVAAPDASQAYAQAAPQQVAQAQYAQPQMAQAPQMEAPQMGGPPRLSGLAALFAGMNPQAGQLYYQRMMQQQMYQAMVTPKAHGGMGMSPGQAMMSLTNPDLAKFYGGLPIKLDQAETPGGYKFSQIAGPNGTQNVYPTANGQAPADLSVRNVKPGEQIQDYSQPAGIGAGAVGPQVGGAPQGRVLGGNTNGMLTPQALALAAARNANGDPGAKTSNRGTLGQLNNAAIDNATAASGITADQIAANTAVFKAQQAATQAFATGQQGNAVRSFSVALDHAQVFKDLAEAMGNKDFRAVNAIKNEWNKQFYGSPLPTNLDAAKQILSAEMAKAIQGSDVAEGDRERLQEALNSSNSWQQLSSAVDNVYKPLLAGQISGMRRQFVNATKQPGENFDKMLSPNALKVLNSQHSESSAVGSTWTDPKTGQTYRVINGKLYH